MAFRFEDDEDRPIVSSGTYKIPDRDFYRRNFTPFLTMHNLLNRHAHAANPRETVFHQPHFSSLADILTPYGNLSNPADGVCCHFLKRGFTKPTKVPFNAAVWSADCRWLVLGTQTGDLALWEGEGLKVYKVVSVPAHKEFGDGDRIKEQIPITSMAWKHHGNLLVTADNRGVIQYCDETFRNVFVTKDAHAGAVRGLSFSPLDTKLASCSDDGRVHIWSIGRDRPDLVLAGHQSDVKGVDWHPHRALIASCSRDATLKLWDPKQARCVSTISAHKKQVNCCMWNMNGNWLASGSTDGMVWYSLLSSLVQMHACPHSTVR